MPTLPGAAACALPSAVCHVDELSVAVVKAKACDAAGDGREEEKGSICHTQWRQEENRLRMNSTQEQPPSGTPRPGCCRAWRPAAESTAGRRGVHCQNRTWF